MPITLVLYYDYECQLLGITGTSTSITIPAFQLIDVPVRVYQEVV